MKTVTEFPPTIRFASRDRYATPCPVFVHPAVIARGHICGVKPLERRTGMRFQAGPGTTYAQLVRA